MILICEEMGTCALLAADTVEVTEGSLPIMRYGSRAILKDHCPDINMLCDPAAVAGLLSQEGWYEKWHKKWPVLQAYLV